jgi:hypothetical protein
MPSIPSTIIFLEDFDSEFPRRNWQPHSAAESRVTAMAPVRNLRLRGITGV